MRRSQNMDKRGEKGKQDLEKQKVVQFLQYGAAYVLVASIFVYGLGYLTSFIQLVQFLHRDYDVYSITALLSYKTVFYQGVKVLVIPVLIIPFILLYNWAYYDDVKIGKPPNSYFVLFVCLIASLFLLLTVKDIKEFMQYLISSIAGIIAGIFAEHEFHKILDTREKYIKLLTWKLLSRLFVIFLISSILISFLVPLGLPRIRVNLDDNTSIVGNFVGEERNFYYLVSEQRKPIGIPLNQIKEIEYIPKEKTSNLSLLERAYGRIKTWVKKVKS